MPNLRKNGYNEGVHQAHHYKRHNRKSFSGFLGGLFSLIILTVCGYLAFRFLPGIFQSRFSRFDRFNLVIASEPVKLISLSTNGKDAVIVTFPDNLYLTHLAHGYGGYPAAKIYAVGELDHRGGEVLTDTVSNYLGIPVDAYLQTAQSPASLKNLVFDKNFWLGPNSNLTWFDRFQIAKLAYSLRFDKISPVNLGKFSEELILADGTKVQTVDTDKLDAIIKDYFTEESLRAENLRLEVVNSTSQLGLANQVARILTNIGLSVVNVGSTSPPISRCQLQVANKAKQSLTVKRLQSIFNCQLDTIAEEGRADISLILGQDYEDRLTK